MYPMTKNRIAMLAALSAALVAGNAYAQDNLGYAHDSRGQAVVDSQGRCVRGGEMLAGATAPAYCLPKVAEQPAPMPAPAPAPMVPPPPPPPPPAPVSPVERTLLEHKPVVITGAHFAFNKYTLLPGASKTLNEVVAFARKYPNETLHVKGYTDNIGSYKYNLRLSQKRAETVARYLESHGVARDRLTTKGYSYKDPVASNATAAGRAKNRRVEITAVVPVKKVIK